MHLRTLTSLTPWLAKALPKILIAFQLYDLSRRRTRTHRHAGTYIFPHYWHVGHIQLDNWGLAVAELPIVVSTRGIHESVLCSNLLVEQALLSAQAGRAAGSA